MARFAGWYQLHRITLAVHNPRRTKNVASLRLWYCDAPVSELQQLRQQQRVQLPAAAATAGSNSSSSTAVPAWKLAVAGVPVAPGQGQVSVELALPLLASCLMVEFCEFHVSVNELAAEVLHCPRCSHVVTDRHGLCSYCRWGVCWVAGRSRCLAAPPCCSPRVCRSSCFPACCP
jgi:E3 ubiquitin-protein ligase UBR4